MEVIKRYIKKNFGHLVYSRQRNPAQKNNIINWYNGFKKKSLHQLSDASYDVFTYHGEDGILFYLIQQLGNVTPLFVDIGSGDCIKSNCANLAVHHGWQGVFIDNNPAQLDVGKKFYGQQLKEGADIHFIETAVTTENANRLLLENAVDNKVGLLSIDIDGNDYWIWDAIKQISPEIVVIEAKAEFGNKSIVVPYGVHNHHSINKEYNGASVKALTKLGQTKGYKLAGANKQGYNLFFVKEQASIPGVSPESVLDNEETIRSFYKEDFFTSHQFTTV